jgi:uncharacterized membrane protein YdbT with pleckstrin-like domain
MVHASSEPLTIGPDEQARVRSITRPDPGLFRVYLFHAVTLTLGVLVAFGILIVNVGRGVEARVLDALRDQPAAPLFLLAGVAGIYGAILLGLYVRYRTLRYRFDEHGVARSWGLLFRQETFLTYTKIQDIQLRRGIVEKWFGVARLAIQTATGTQGASEMLEGLREYELVQAYLREKMKGLEPVASPALEGERDPVAVLSSICDELRALRATVIQRNGSF